MHVYVSIDTYACNGCAGCVGVCPELFRISELTGKAEVEDGCVELTPALEEAVSLCPVSCIEIEEC